jgi:integrase/recombinase XerD
MTDLIAIQKIAGWEKLKTLVLDSVSSPITKRVYNMALDEFLGWFQQAPRPGFTKATVSASRVSLRTAASGRRQSSLGCPQSVSWPAADNRLLAPELAAGITRVKSAKTQGIRTGNWLSLPQAQALLSAPDTSTTKGLRDRAIIAVLLGCGLRRSEVAALTFAHVQQRDGRWCIVDLVGKHGRVRTAPMPNWVTLAVDAWTSAAVLADGRVFRSLNRADRASGEVLSEKVVWQIIKPYADSAGVPGIAPHDLRRPARSCAELEAGNSSRSSCCWATLPCRRPSGISAQSRT